MIELLGGRATQAPPEQKRKQETRTYTRGDLLGELDHVIVEAKWPQGVPSKKPENQCIATVQS